MEKFLVVNNGNYTVQVQDTGTITLDTGTNGTVYVTGNLTVQGTTTTVESTVVTIEDKVITLNYGELGAGINGGTGKSGIEVDRGSLSNAKLQFNELTNWRNTATATTDTGVWEIVNEAETVTGALKVATIVTQSDQDITFDISSNVGISNTALIKVYATDYSTRIAAAPIGDADKILVTKKYVDDTLALVTSSINIGDTEISINDDPTLGVPGGEITFTVDAIQMLYMTYPSTPVITFFDTEQMNFSQNQIVNESITSPLTISANEGHIQLENIVSLQVQPYNAVTVPASVPGHAQVYAGNTIGSGGTGLYFVPTSGNPDELISKTKSLVYSIIF
jgi:hypothetical protein